MIYLISIKNNNLIKIGYTNDFKERKKKYWTALASTLQIIDVIEGTREDEKNYHLVLEYLGFEKADDERDTEWYKIPSNISKREILKYGFKCLY